MYLKKLVLHGFKSFAHKTEIVYHPGITAIVGPNGCGKSNVIDAVRWALGEQRAKALRSEKMDNVIFNGTSKRKPLGLAEVSLIIENNRSVLPVEYNEVMITRRLYRSGESEYLLNNAQCRLKDISDLFMDTGMGSGAYSVIELKMIEEILSENVHERRRLFEEAAGITKYKIRRRQALQKLEGTQQDLARVRDLVEELERQVRSLSNQAGKARRYQQFKTRLTFLETTLAQQEYERLKTETAQLSERQTAAQQELEALTAALVLQEAEVEEHRVYLLKLETDLADVQRLRATLMDEIRKLEADVRVEKERQTQSEKNIARLKHEAVEADLRYESLTEQAEKLRKALGEHEVQSVQLSGETATAKSAQQAAQAAYDAALRQLETIRTNERQLTIALSGKRNDLNRLVNKAELLETEKRRLTQEQQQQTTAQSGLSERIQSAEKTVEETQIRTETQRHLLREAEQRHEELNRTLNEAQQVLRNLERNVDALSAEIRLREGLAASYEAFSESVQFLAKRTDWSAQPPKTVADLFACDPEDQLALDTALRDFAACFVVESDEEAQAAIGLLRTQGKGQSAFLILNRMRSLKPVQTADLPNAPALRNRVRVEETYAHLADLLLQNTYLTETLEQAREWANRDQTAVAFRFVTRTGEWADSMGTIQGGSKRKASAAAHRLGLRERLSQLKADFEQAETQREAQTKSVQQTRTELGGILLHTLREQVRVAERVQTDAEKAAERISVEQSVSGRRTQEILGRLEAVTSEIGQTRAQLAGLEAEVQTILTEHQSAEAERQDAERAFSGIETERRTAANRFNELNIRVVQAENHLQNLRNDLKRRTDDAESLKRRAGHRQSEIENAAQNQDKAATEQRALEQKVLALYSEKAQFDEQVQEAERNVAQSRAAISEDETKIRETRRKRDDFQREDNRLEVQQAERRTRLEALLQRTLEELGLDLTEEVLQESASDAEESSPLHEAEARKEVADLRQKIRALGAVNELALEDYEREKERLDFIVLQLKDLEAAEKTLLDTIQEINTTATKRFTETFAEINQHFKTLFEGLFNPGDTAQLIMDDSDPLEAGIKIIAKPRGKQPSGISQLSGGEKTLTAIALLFAIYLVKPSPFCILDEVDAPLDDANVERFMRLIRQFVHTTQFILVTHNKLTMEAADRMYGVTMQEMGVSKVVSVSFDGNGQEA